MPFLLPNSVEALKASKERIDQLNKNSEVKHAITLWLCLSESVQVDSEAQYSCHDSRKVTKDTSMHAANCG